MGFKIIGAQYMVLKLPLKCCKVHSKNIKPPQNVSVYYEKSLSACFKE